MQEKIYTDPNGQDFKVVLSTIPYGRENTLNKTFGHLPANPFIVEIGCARNPLGKIGDGWSTLGFAMAAQLRKGHVLSIDIDPNAIAFARWLTQDYDCVDFYCGDVFDFIANAPLPERIDLLYLDAWNPREDKDSGQKHFDVFDQFEEKDRIPGLVLIDDVYPFQHPLGLGKGEIIVPYLQNRGDFEEIFFQEGQVLFKRR